MAYGLNTSISRLGSVLNGAVLPQIYNKSNMGNLGLALSVGLGICVFSYLCALVLCKIQYLQNFL